MHKASREVRGRIDWLNGKGRNPHHSEVAQQAQERNPGSNAEDYEAVFGKILSAAKCNLAWPKNRGRWYATATSMI